MLSMRPTLTGVYYIYIYTAASCMLHRQAQISLTANAPDLDVVHPQLASKRALDLNAAGPSAETKPKACVASAPLASRTWQLTLNV